ncbi:TonB-dependent receptor domain-containing protein [Novosphingobium colocasiae]
MAGLRYSGEALTLDASYQLSDTRRRYYDPTFFSPEPNYETQGQTRRAQLAGSYDILPALRLDFGADHEWSRFDVSFEERRRANLSSGHAMLGWYSEAVTVAAGLRYDDHSRFGDAWTFGANGSVALVGELRARASYGEGFKVPTLYQLFFPTTVMTSYTPNAAAAMMPDWNGAIATARCSPPSPGSGATVAT